MVPLESINEMTWLHGANEYFREHRKSNSGFGQLGVFLTIDRDLAEHYGSVVLDNQVKVSNPLMLGKDDWEKWAELSRGEGHYVEQIQAEYDSVIYRGETELGNRYMVLVVFDPEKVTVTTLAAHPGDSPSSGM